MPMHREEEGSERRPPGPAAPRCTSSARGAAPAVGGVVSEVRSIALAGRAPCAPALCPPPRSVPLRSLAGGAAATWRPGSGRASAAPRCPPGGAGSAAEWDPAGRSRAVPSRRGAAVPTSLLPALAPRRALPMGSAARRRPGSTRPRRSAPARGEYLAPPCPPGPSCPSCYPPSRSPACGSCEYPAAAPAAPPQRPSAAPVRGLQSPARPGARPAPGCSGRESTRVSSLMRGTGCHRCRPACSDSARAGGRHPGCPDLRGQ